MSVEHFVIPDTQVKPGVPINHLEAAGNYIVDKKPDVLIHLGDHWDMHSLSIYDKGTKKGEGVNYQEDIDSGQEGMQALLAPINRYNDRRRKYKEKLYKPKMVFCLGNHEQRIERYTNANPELIGKCTYADFELEKSGWEVYDFLDPVDVHGILYCHYFVNPSSLKKNVLGGNVDNKLRHIGQSFTMGHQQTLQIGLRYLNNGTCQRGLVCGSFYQHEEDYMGHQGNHHYRGCLYKHEVKNGNYCLMELSLDYLLAEWF